MAGGRPPPVAACARPAAGRRALRTAPPSRPASAGSPRSRPSPRGRRRSPRTPGSRPAARPGAGTASSRASRPGTAPGASPARPSGGAPGTRRPGRAGPAGRSRLVASPRHLGRHGPGVRWWAAAPRGRGLEVELVDVGLVEDLGRAEEDLAVLADRLLAEVPGLEGLALLAGDLAGAQRRRGVGGQVAELARVPELEGLDGAVLDELAHLVGGAEPGEGDLALVGGAAEVAG